MPFFILRPCQFLARSSQQLYEAAVSVRLGTQALDGAPPLRDCLFRASDCSIQNLNGFFGPTGKHVASRLKSKQQSVERLQQRVVQFAGDARPLAHSLFQACVEFLCDLMEAKAVQRPEQSQKSGRARRLEPGGLI